MKWLILLFPLTAFANVLTWDAAPGADSYQVWRKDSKCGTTTAPYVLVAPAVTEVTWTDPDVPLPWKACYYVIAENFNGESLPSNEAGKRPGKPSGVGVN